MGALVVTSHSITSPLTNVASVVDSARLKYVRNRGVKTSEHLKKQSQW
jgi:hypothetical protein